ncbi:Fc receptor-like protein 5 isoform X1 [Onychostoma macrolepis]|uniref:Fc receptor-like protein 5 isoform X1 n=1 Tax=Onychostoma macrolepis TaxID=369639 RepID=UPI00272D0093|nr:Fc receptor-like protein 5 isoform X1 [Onychostoma macrolepis]
MELVTGTSTGSSSPESKIKIGDKVYVKPSVVTPRYQWGSVTHKSIGVVKDIQGETLIVDFPEQKNWKAVISEMELVTGTSTGSSSPESKIKIGDKVYVKPSVVTPRHQWGSVTHKSIGVVKDIQGETLIVDFPEQKNWKAVISEMELVTGTSTERPKPVVKVKPDQAVFREEKVTLTCDIQGVRSIQWTYSWFKDGNTHNPYRTTAAAELSFKADNVSYSGKYSCRGERSDSQKSDISDEVTLTVSDLPRSTLTMTPSNPVFTGETVNLTCKIETYSDWRYEWYKGSINHAMLQTSERHTVNRDTLTIRELIIEDGDLYFCGGKRDGRPNLPKSSSAVSLIVRERPKPVVKVKPDQAVFREEKVTLTCDIQGARSIQWTYSWFKDGNTHNPYRTTAAAELSFKADNVSYSGKYSCRGERSDSQKSDISDEVTLTVSDLPRSTLTMTPSNPVFTGETVNLTCKIETYSDWRYEWYKGSINHAMLQTSERHTVNRDTLTIRELIIEDGDLYFCGGKRDGRPNLPKSSSAVSLIVRERPKPVVKVKPDQAVFREEKVTLTCDIQGVRSIQWTYSWFKDGNTHNPYRTTAAAELSFKADNVSYSGKYSCRGERSDSQKSDISDEVTLTVSDLPRSTLTMTPSNPVFTGETVNLTCKIETYSDWKYEWYKGSINHAMLQTSERHTVNRDTLTIRELIIEDGDLYFCGGKRDGRPNLPKSSSAVSLIVRGLKLKPDLRSDPTGAALTGNAVTLTCHMDPSTGYWDFYWYKHTLNPEPEKTETNSYRLKIDSVSDGGQYWCRAGRGEPIYYTNYSDALWVNVTESPKAVVMVRPDKTVFKGEKVTLRCDIKWVGDTEWTYRWEINGTSNKISTQELNISSVDDFHSGNYTCSGQINTQSSQRSDAVTLTVSAEAQATVRVSPQPWLTEGESATLICEVSGSSTGWTFSWFRDHKYLSDSSTGAGGSYTLCPAALQHTGVYTCRAERGRAAYHARNSSTQPLWVTGVSASVSLVLNPSRSQHFSSDSLSLNCEDQSDSAGWTVRRYTDNYTETCSKLTGSACVIDSLSTSDTGVYWCQSESGEKRHLRNITVHDGAVILVSSVDPVIEGETLTLHCLHRSTNSSILSTDFYKDGSLVQNQTTGEMSISAVSKSNEGFYYCKRERGQSPHSWITVTGVHNLSHKGLISVFNILLFLAASLCLLATAVLLFKCYRVRVSSAEGQYTVTEEETSI